MMCRGCRDARHRNVINLSKKEAFWAIHLSESGFSGLKDFQENLVNSSILKILIQMMSEGKILKLMTLRFIASLQVIYMETLGKLPAATATTAASRARTATTAATTGRARTTAAAANTAASRWTRAATATTAN
jgi:hypothetical protein